MGLGGVLAMVSRARGWRRGDYGGFFRDGYLLPARVLARITGESNVLIGRSRLYLVSLWLMRLSPVRAAGSYVGAPFARPRITDRPFGNLRARGGARWRHSDQGATGSEGDNGGVSLG